MTSDIDYDELDQAVTGVMESDTPPEPPDDAVEESPQEEPTKDSPEAPPTPAANPTPRPKPRGFYMDMVTKKTPMRPLPRHKTPPISAPTPPSDPPLEHTTEFGVIEDNFIPEEPSGDTPPYIDTALAAQEADRAEEDAGSADPSPPEAYSLSGRSPFIENAVVEKRPLTRDIPPTNSRTIVSTKNVYSERLPSAKRPTTPSPVEHEIIPTKQKSGIGRFLLVLAVIAAGALIGAAAWFLSSSNFKL